MNSRFIRLSLSVSRLEKKIRQLKMEGMQEFDLKGEQTLILYVLYESSQKMTFSSIKDTLQLDGALISRNLKTLQEKGLIEKLQEKGKYKAQYQLTENGQHTAGQIAKMIAQAEKEARKDISDEEMEVFYSVIDRLCISMENLPEEWRKHEY